ncbi:putative autophagy-related protein 5 [Blattamonas nauphoetae]|uniref:Autophagy-related protein 5 n=1 Tax=Blattamonas nauphoetae TaxID=2049346 RepID=A0ABQ9Y1P8_9EUKA|nr:putative autophagy-related protein 5 [Blattamonas nauphoetae]
MTQNLWNNVISVRFQLLDQTCETKPDDLILNLPFCTYLPLHTIEISQHFFTHEIESPLWFSCDQKLLDWNLPLGVLFDIFQCSRHQTSDSFSDPYSRPWTVEVNISAFPSRQLMHLFSFDAMASSFNQQIKEALQLTSHSAQIYQRASPTTKIELFTAVSTGIPAFDTTFISLLFFLQQCHQKHYSKLHSIYSSSVRC